MSSKVYIDVNCNWTKEGKVIPKLVTWEDSRRFAIDKVIDIRKAGETGLRYTVSVRGRESYLFLEDSYTGEKRWFAKAKDSQKRKTMVVAIVFLLLFGINKTVGLYKNYLIDFHISTNYA